MKFHFLPALRGGRTPYGPTGRKSSQFLGLALRSRQSPIMKTIPPPWGTPLLNWVDEETREHGGYYPHMLITYMAFRHIAIELPCDGFIFGDSSGYSAIRYGTNELDPIDILRWQSGVCTVGAILDLPPVNTQDEPKDWPGALDVTIKNVKRALPLYNELRQQQHRFHWWGVIHGWTVKQMNEWHKKVSAVYPFDAPEEGWAMKPRPRSHHPDAVARCLHWLATTPIKRTHLFAAFGYKAIATLLALGPEAGLELATTDSARLGKLAEGRRIVVQSEENAYQWGIMGETKDTPGDPRNARRTYREVRDYLLYQCTCFSCRSLQKDVEDPQHPAAPQHDRKTQRWEGGTPACHYWRLRFEYHSLLVTRDIVAAQKQLALTDPHALLRTVLSPKAYTATLQAFDGRSGLQVQSGMTRSLLDWA